MNKDKAQNEYNKICKKYKVSKEHKDGIVTLMTGCSLNAIFDDKKRASEQFENASEAMDYYNIPDDIKNIICDLITKGISASEIDQACDIKNNIAVEIKEHFKVNI